MISLFVIFLILKHPIIFKNNTRKIEKLPFYNTNWNEFTINKEVRLG